MEIYIAITEDELKRAFQNVEIFFRKYLIIMGTNS